MVLEVTFAFQFGILALTLILTLNLNAIFREYSYDIFTRFVGIGNIGNSSVLFSMMMVDSDSNCEIRVFVFAFLAVFNTYAFTFTFVYTF